MAQIRFSDSDDTVEASAVQSILNAFIREGIGIRHDCGGRALCGTCRIRISSGAENLSPKGEREIARLAAVDAAPNERLACQTYCRKTATVTIREKKAPADESERPRY
jgi:ferredoxin